MPAEFRVRRAVRFAETDMAGVMHFSNYYRWMEDIEHAFWRSLGTSVVRGEISWPRVSCRCDYHRPVRFEDEVELTLRVTRLGGRSVGFAIDFHKDGQVVASGEMTTVCCRLQAGRFAAVEIPTEIREALAAGVAAGEQE